MMAGKRCIDCGKEIGRDDLKLNETGLWCVKHEQERRARISAAFEDISRSFDPPSSPRQEGKP